LKTLYTAILVVSFTSVINPLFAQSFQAQIEKNYNVRASSLSHELNTTKDTLHLKSERKITHVYSINSEYKREIDVYLDTTTYKLPLTNLSKGKHLLVVGESPKKIVFVIRIMESSDTALSLEQTKLSYSNN
jgi:hypothetical protein